MGPNGTRTCKRCHTLGHCDDMGHCFSCRKKAIEALERQDKCPYYAPPRGTGTGRNASILKITYQFLEAVIGLDENHFVVDVICESTDRSRRTFRAVIQGPKMHHNFEGAELPWISVEELRERIDGVS